MVPDTRYARNGEVNLAYGVHGEGPIDLLFVSAFISHVEHVWEEPGLRRFLERLGSFGRLIRFDRRGTSMSDDGPLDIEHELGDITAVLDAVGSERVALLGYAAGGPLAALYAARYPERVGALVLYSAMLHTTRDDDLPWVRTAEERTAQFEATIERWGEGTNLAALAPSVAGDEQTRAWMARLERLSASPGQMRRLVAATGESDVRPELPRIRVPTLVLHRTDDAFMDVRHGREYARRIPGAQMVELPGTDSLPSAGDADALLGEIEQFLTGGRHSDELERALLTVLFTDIVDGTARAAEIGDKRWRDLLSSHDAAVRRALRGFDGQEVKTVGDGFLAVFGGAPSRAVRCAQAIRDAVVPLGVHVRIGLHTGECELIGDDVGGMAVHIAARVCALAGAGEVLASGTTYGTVVGAGLRWEDRGSHALKGVPGAWPVFALAAAGG
jgi:class 3 adenylate cyclase